MPDPSLYGSRWYEFQTQHFITYAYDSNLHDPMNNSNIKRYAFMLSTKLGDQPLARFVAMAYKRSPLLLQVRMNGSISNIGN
jgi:hypothetical protein